MPITDLAEAKDLDDAIQALLDAPAAERERRLRAIFVEKLDFTAASGAVRLPGTKVKVAGSDQPAPAPIRIAQSAGMHVLWARFAEPKIGSANTRAVVKALRDQMDGDHLLVVSNADDSLWHIVRPSATGGRTVLRRMVIERSLPRRTAVTQLARIYEPAATADTLCARVDAAFDVAPVTKEFFKTYADVFNRVSTMIRGIPDEEALRLFCQTLFNRLMFIYFLQRKGWLSLNGDRNYLKALRDDSKRTNDGNFYRDRLLVLFFSALNNPGSRDLSRGVQVAVGDVPFLNGGLFEKGHIDQECAGATVPDEAFDLIFDRLFERFNFTVSESTPYDIEIAVDPEMLGKVFEELVTGRHETGSYYTPRPVVSFMCREALKGYLIHAVDGAGAGALAKLVDEHDVSGINLAQAAAVVQALDRIAVVDPACGSGAYLLGMLHELTELKQELFSQRLQRDPDQLYQMKLDIIERNIYGVDIDEFATNIAMLRLWLSLSIEFEGTTPKPLPNLDFKILCGDSLTAPNPANAPTLFRNAVHEAANELARLKGEYMLQSGALKAATKRKVLDAEDELDKTLATVGGGAPVGAADWRVDYAEVFERGGFDVVLANPPYVRADAQYNHLRAKEKTRNAAVVRWKAYRKQIGDSKVYTTLFDKWDLYIPFLERACQLLNPNGQMVFIISDAYNSSKYAEKSRAYLWARTEIKRIDFCSEIPLFEAGVRNTILHVAATPEEPRTLVRARRWGESADAFDANCQILSEPSPPLSADAAFRFTEQVLAADSPSFVNLGEICYLSWGLRPNSDERSAGRPFKTNDVISARRDPTHPLPILQGKDTVKWIPVRTRYLEWGTARAPAQYARQTFPQLYAVDEKLLLMKVSGARPRVVYDNKQHVCTDSFCVAVAWSALAGVSNASIRKSARYSDEPALGPLTREQLEGISRQFDLRYLIGVLNSRRAGDILNGRRRNRIQLYPNDWRDLPIPFASPPIQKTVSTRVTEIIELLTSCKGAPSDEQERRLLALEASIDEIVNALYLTERT